MNKYRQFSFFSVVVVVALIGMVLQASGQEKAKSETAPKETIPFTIVRLVVGTGIEDREPVGVAESFPASTERVSCFLEAADIVNDIEVSFVWYNGQSELLKFNLPLQKGPRWRTSAFKNLYGQKGDWKVEIRDAEGKLLKDVKFKVE